MSHNIASSAKAAIGFVADPRCVNRGGESHRSRAIRFALLTRRKPNLYVSPIAQVAELVDALASGASGCKVVKVRVLSWAPPPSKQAF
jgi:hypothetical protein